MHIANIKLLCTCKRCENPRRDVCLGTKRVFTTVVRSTCIQRARLLDSEEFAVQYTNRNILVENRGYSTLTHCINVSVSEHIYRIAPW